MVKKSVKKAQNPSLVVTAGRAESGFKEHLVV